jgi:hypothetical protein
LDWDAFCVRILIRLHENIQFTGIKLNKSQIPLYEIDLAFIIIWLCIRQITHCIQFHKLF